MLLLLLLPQVSMSALAAGWNALALDLRERDLLNNRELAALTFEQLQLTHSQKQHLRELPHVGDLGLTSVLPARCGVATAPRPCWCQLHCTGHSALAVRHATALFMPSCCQSC